MNTRSVLALGITSALALSSCGNGGESDAGGGAETEVASELNIAYSSQPPTLDPLITTAVATRILARTFYEPLLAVDHQGEVQTVLAEDYEISEDGLTMTFTLREDVPFHDGSIMEAEDVVASLERWIETTQVGQSYFSEAAVASSEEGVVTLTMAEPMYVAPELLADSAQSVYVMPATVIAEAGPEGVQEHVGTGPYQYGDWATDQYLRVDRFEDYVSPEGDPIGMTGEKTAHYQEIYFQFVDDAQTRQAGLQGGEYDLSVPIPWDNADAIDADENTEVVLGESGFTIIIFNKQQGPMADVNMRRAVYHAFEPEASMQAAYGTETYYTMNAALVSEDSPWYVEPSQEQREMYEESDPDLVNQYLEEAGYDGEEITILTTRDQEDHYDQAVVLQQQLAEHGINAELEVTDWPSVQQNREDPDSFDLTITGIAWVNVPVLFHFLHPWWVGWTEDEAIAEALDEIVYAATEEDAIAAMGDLQDAYYEYLPVMKFGDRRTPAGMSSEVQDYQFVEGPGEIFHHVRPAD